MPTLTTADQRTVLGAWRSRHRSDLAAHVDHHGPLPVPQPGDTAWGARFAALIDTAGLTGRGGAAFPSARKLALVRGAGPGCALVVNAMEGEPASCKDRVLLTCAPHLVLDGAALAASALGASDIVLCVPADSHDAARTVERAVAERLGTVLAPVPVRVLRPPGRYVAGEESALVSYVNGGPSAPLFRPDKGVALTVGRRAALVHNAETLAHMALIARHGASWFKAAGTDAAPGTTLVTLSGAVEHPGVYEVAMGTSVPEIIGRARPVADVAAVLVGGFAGTWVTRGDLDVAYAPGPLASLGAGVGAGVLVVLPANACGIAETARIARFMAGESAGQCGPCVFGLPAVAEDLAGLARGRVDAALDARLHQRLHLVTGRGACRHPDGVARMVRSALVAFASDAAAHGAGAPCAFTGAAAVVPRPARGRAMRAAAVALRPREDPPRETSPPGTTVRVDPVACDAYGYCAELLPELVTLDEWGYPVVDGRTVPADLLALAEQAARDCPRRAFLLARPAC